MTRINNRLQRACALLLVVTLSGCAARMGDLTIASTKNIDLSDTHLYVRDGKRAEGEDCVYYPLGIFPLGLPNLQDAVEDALNNGHGNVIVNEVTHKTYVYFILASRICIKVDGTVLNTALKK